MNRHTLVANAFVVPLGAIVGRKDFAALPQCANHDTGTQAWDHDRPIVPATFDPHHIGARRYARRG